METTIRTNQRKSVSLLLTPYEPATHALLGCTLRGVGAQGHGGAARRDRHDGLWRLGRPLVDVRHARDQGVQRRAHEGKRAEQVEVPSTASEYLFPDEVELEVPSTASEVPFFGWGVVLQSSTALKMFFSERGHDSLGESEYPS